MKKVTAIIRPEKLEELKDAINRDAETARRLLGI